jgi:hypothetical protein
MRFNATGKDAQGSAIAFTPNPPVSEMKGTISGSIEGYAVNLKVQWDNGPIGKYDGSVNADGIASGTTYDIKNPGSSAGWSSSAPLQCVTPG